MKNLKLLDKKKMSVQNLCSKLNKKQCYEVIMQMSIALPEIQVLKLTGPDILFFPRSLKSPRLRRFKIQVSDPTPLFLPGEV